jgi:redox-regulated HSP33 family molecular chaperone
VLRTLAETVEPAAFKELFGLSSLEVRETRPLQFLCRCSQSKTLFVLGTLRVEELDRLVKAGTPQRVICHMCGETYVAKPEDIAEVLVRKQNASPGQ